MKKEEHPAGELLEQFALRRLKAEEMLELFRHLDTCAPCRASLQAEYDYIETMREALKLYRDPGPA